MNRSRPRSYAPTRRRSAPARTRAKPARRRRQHVALRGRRKEAMSRQLRGVLLRGGIALSVLTIAGLFLWHSDSWLQRKIQQHTPLIEIQADKECSLLPISNLLPVRRWWLWMPGMSTPSAHRIQKQFLVVGHARFETHFSDNKIIVHLESRHPLAQWNGQGIDQEGILFPLSSDAMTTLPSLVNVHAPLPRTIGPWLSALAHVPWLWSNVAEIKEDGLHEWALVLRSGPVIFWGSSDEPVAPRAAVLEKIMAQAQTNYGGALRADLRFFPEGRIIVAVRRSLH